MKMIRRPTLITRCTLKTRRTSHRRPWTAQSLERMTKTLSTRATPALISVPLRNKRFTHIALSQMRYPSPAPSSTQHHDRDRRSQLQTTNRPGGLGTGNQISYYQWMSSMIHPIWAQHGINKRGVTALWIWESLVDREEHIQYWGKTHRIAPSHKGRTPPTDTLPITSKRPLLPERRAARISGTIRGQIQGIPAWRATCPP